LFYPSLHLCTRRPAGSISTCRDGASRSWTFSAKNRGPRMEFSVHVKQTLGANVNTICKSYIGLRVRKMNKHDEELQSSKTWKVARSQSAKIAVFNASGEGPILIISHPPTRHELFRLRHRATFNLTKNLSSHTTCSPTPVAAAHGRSSTLY